MCVSVCVSVRESVCVHERERLCVCVGGWVGGWVGERAKVSEFSLVSLYSTARVPYSSDARASKRERERQRQRKSQRRGGGEGVGGWVVGGVKSQTLSCRVNHPFRNRGK